MSIPCIEEYLSKSCFSWARSAASADKLIKQYRDMGKNYYKDACKQDQWKAYCESRVMHYADKLMKAIQDNQISVDTDNFYKYNIGA